MRFFEKLWQTCERRKTDICGAKEACPRIFGRKQDSVKTLNNCSPVRHSVQKPFTGIFEDLVLQNQAVELNLCECRYNDNLDRPFTADEIFHVIELVIRSSLSG